MHNIELIVHSVILITLKSKLNVELIVTINRGGLLFEVYN